MAMRKGITPIVATVVLLLVVVAVAGAAYTYIAGFWGGLTSTVLQLRSSTCNTSGGVAIYVRNVGTNNIDLKDPAKLEITRSVISGLAGTQNIVYKNTTGSCAGATCIVAPQGAGTVTDAACGTGNTCRYTMVGGGASFDAQVTCY